MISEFKGDNFFLSNFFPCPVNYYGVWYRNAEAAFQAQKRANRFERDYFTHLTAAEAKKLGRKIEIRPDWEEIKIQVMWEVLMAKFSSNPQLKELLARTGDEELVEGNYWKDYFWGVCQGKGQNILGRLLMMVRYEMTKYERLKEELETTGTGTMKCFGDSMKPVLKSGSKMTFAKAEKYEVGDYVFCKVKGYYIDCHVLKAKNRRKGYLISNMDGWDNGWTHTIFGKAVSAELDGKIYWRAKDDPRS